MGETPCQKNLAGDGGNAISTNVAFRHEVSAVLGNYVGNFAPNLCQDLVSILSYEIVSCS